jgi:hypothetical protein
VDKPAGHEPDNGAPERTRDHSVTDLAQPDRDPTGVIDDAGLPFRIGLALAQRDRVPHSREGAPFERVRDSSINRAKARASPNPQEPRVFTNLFWS